MAPCTCASTAYLVPVEGNSTRAMTLYTVAHELEYLTPEGDVTPHPRRMPYEAASRVRDLHNTHTRTD